MPLPSEHADELINAGIYFLQAVGRAYGSTPALEAWERLADAVDPDLKPAVFLAMLNGGASGHITIKNQGTANPIAVIKAIRTWDKGAPGLKEAKDMLDGLRDWGRPIKVNVAFANATQARRAFAELGCTVF